MSKHYYRYYFSDRWRRWAPYVWVTGKFHAITNFFRNAWAFRRELAGFGPYDYGLCLKFLTRSLTLTADFMESDKAMACASKDHAEEIRQFVETVENSQSAYDLATVNLGYEPSWTIPWHENSELPVAEKVRRTRWTEEVDRLERVLWHKAWADFERNAQHWWD